MTLAARLEGWLDGNSDARWPRRDELLAWAGGFDDEAAAWEACARGADVIALAGLRGASGLVVVPIVGRAVRAVVARLPAKEPRLLQAVHAAETAADGRSASARAKLLDHAQRLLADAEKAEQQRKRLGDERNDVKGALAKAAFAAVARAAGFVALATAEVQRSPLVQCAYALDDVARAIAAFESGSLAEAELEAGAARASADQARALREALA